jgi:dual specificity tyrosine-phosphorylation-regulated kinase 1
MNHDRCMYCFCFAFVGVSLKLIRKFAGQLLATLEFLRSVPQLSNTDDTSSKISRCGVVHGDMKPENIVLHHHRKSSLMLIDFGCASFGINPTLSYIQSRHYRCPEVLLRCPYNTQADMWSLGCLLFELHVGKPLFVARTEAQQILNHVALLGIPPSHMIETHMKTSATVHHYFQYAADRGEWQLKQTPLPTRNLQSMLSKYHTNRQEYDLFIDFILSLLQYDPKKRPKPYQAYQHPFLSFTTTTQMVLPPPPPPPLPSPPPSLPSLPMSSTISTTIATTISNSTNSTNPPPPPHAPLVSSISNVMCD